MRQVADWLEKLGMSEYAERFAENRIDFSVLPELTDQDLKDLGVILGDRRKILRAIAALASTPAAQPAPVIPPAPSVSSSPPRAASPVGATSAPLPAAEAAGERRYLTVMFCDLVGSTAISAQLDAEEWRDLVGAYLDAASAAVADMGGHVAKKLGDGLMCLFGYPLAHENDAERAARAALSIQRALAELNRKNAATAKPELVARIGLESGPAVLDASGEIYGDVANIAARVQALAEPGAVLITARVQRQVAGLFVAEERGTHALKGVPEPTVLYRLVRASGGGRRSGQRNLTPLVGRDEEIATLMRRWERARQGEGQLVLIVGEPGLGKSRLTEEFHLRLKETPHTWSEWTCSQLLQNTPLHPIAEFGRQRFGGADVPAEQRLADLENMLAQIKLDPGEHASLLAPLLDIPLPKERVSTLAPEELRRRQLAALTNWVMSGAKVQPVVLAFEDLHWADPTTLDVLRSIAERGAQVPLYIVATARPEFRPPWGMRSHHGTISLAPLDRAQVRDMVGELSARHALARDVVDDVAARTGGVPLFVEEVTRLLLERGEQGGAQAIPPTLQQSLMARLDRLGPAREVAQIGSVIGRGFSYKLLKAVAGMDDAPLEAALEKLSDADIVLVEGVLPESDYRFKHALIQDAAYENLLKSRRQVLHRRIAETLRDRFAERAAAEPEVLAHHFTQAGLTDAAIEWWGRAGDQALRRSAFQEAIAHLGKAIEIADKDAKPPQRSTQSVPTSLDRRLRLQTNYGHAIAMFRGFTSDETKVAFTKAQQMLAGIDDPSERYRTYSGLWLTSFSHGDVASAREIAETFWHDAGNASRPTETAFALAVLGATCFMQGDFGNALKYLKDAIQIYDPQRDREAKLLFDTGAFAAQYLALAHWVLGEGEEAREVIGDARRRAIGSAQAPALAMQYLVEAIHEALRGDAKAAQRAAELCIDVSRAHGVAVFLSDGIGYLGWARAELEDRKAGIAQLNECISTHVEHGNRVYIPLFQGLLSEIEGREEGGSEAGLKRIDDAIALTSEMGTRWCEAFLLHIRGKILLNFNPPSTEAAENAFLSAIAVAQQQRARGFELRSALSLAKLYQSTGRPVDAHAVLAPALEGFSPTPEFPEIAEAQALLAALAETDEVKSAAAARQRRFKLQTSLGQALMWGKGFGSEESKAAFVQARELAGGLDDPAERASAYYGVWLGSLTRAEIAQAQETAEAFLKDANQRPGSPEAGLAHRNYGITRWFQGDFVGAREHAEQVLAIYDRDRDRELAFKFGLDYGISTVAFLALILWPIGQVDRARRIAEEAVSQALQMGHVVTLYFARQLAAYVEMIRGDSGRATPYWEACFNLAREHGMQQPLLASTYGLAWARWRAGLEKAEAQAAQMRDVRAQIRESHYLLFDPLYAKVLADVEMGAGHAESALGVINEAISEAEQTGQSWFDAELYRARGELLLQCGRPDTSASEAAFEHAIDVARRQQTRAFELRAALSLAKLYQSAGRPADAHGVLAPAFEGFSPTPEYPEIAEAQALVAALAETDEVKNAAAARQRRLKLQTSYGRALSWAKGYAAPETAAAFARARDLAASNNVFAERFATLYGQWSVSLLRADLAPARQSTEAMLADAEKQATPPEMAVAHRTAALTCFLQGAFEEAQSHADEALRIYDPQWDRDTKLRTNHDTAATATMYLALASWMLGDADRARKLAGEATAHVLDCNHVPTTATAGLFKALFETINNRADIAGRDAQALIGLMREHATPTFLAFAIIIQGWARARLGERVSSIVELNEGLNDYIRQGNRIFLPLFWGLLAEIEAEGNDAEGALKRVDEALALAVETGEHWSDAFVHRIRGKILLKRDAGNAAPAEEAFLTAIAIAQQQKSRSFELRAALSVARLYQSTGRPADAHAVLAPALEGFSPTQEFPEVAEAQALLAALADTDEVKNAAAARQRRLKLQTSYGQAMMLSRGFAAEETRTAFARVRELAAGIDDPAERFVAYYGLWTGNLMRGEMSSARETAETFRREAESGSWTTEAAVACRCLGLACLHQGDFVEARANFARTLSIYDPAHDRDAEFRFGMHPAAAAPLYLAWTNWLLGDFGQVRNLIDETVARAAESAHIPTLINVHHYISFLEIVRGNAGAVQRESQTVVELSREHGTPLYAAVGAISSIWAHARRATGETGAAELRQALAAYTGQGNKLWAQLISGLVGELEAEEQGVDQGLAEIDKALLIAQETGQHWTDAFLHRMRGEILGKRNPADTRPAEEAFLAAIAIAQQQKAKSFELQAALQLAKLYQSTGRPADAHAVLAPALEGFSPTPEFPGIEQAQALLTALR